jgi:chromosome segregation ATPase
MARAAEELETAQQDMSTQRSRDIRDAIARAGEEALGLARRQTAIRRRMRGTGPNGIKAQLGVQSALVQGFRNMADNLEARAGLLSSDVAELWSRIREAYEALEQTLASMEGETRATSTAQRTAESAVRGLNRVALAALASGEQGSEGSASANQVMAQLERLAQQQAQINNQATQVTQMQLGQEAMAQQLQRLSQGQGEVAGELEELEQQPSAEGQVLGDLESLVEEARQLAALLGGGRLDAETRERQERLFHRLLDAGRTLENEEFARDRESTSTGTFERGAVLPVGLDALGALRYALPSADQLRQLSTAERELVLRYFDRLNRATGGAR